jgi:hypothetical protein
MNANSTHGQPPVDDGDFLSHLRRANRALLSRRAASNYNQVIAINLHKCEKTSNCRSTNLASAEPQAKGTLGIEGQKLRGI